MLQLLTCTHFRDNILTEQQMMEDKIKATDWEATNEAIEEQVWSSTALVQYLESENLLLLQVARESYLQWVAEQEKQKAKAQQKQLEAAAAAVAARAKCMLYPGTETAADIVDRREG